MSDQEQAEPTPPAPAEPLFSLDLGVNGGVLEPSTVDDLQKWVAEEVNFWSWIQRASVGNHQGAISQAYGSLGGASSQAAEAASYAAPGQESALQQRLSQVQNHIRAAFLTYGLPHSSTSLARRVAALKSNPRAAAAYLYPFLKSADSYQFDARDNDSWRGFISGLIDKYSIVADIEPKIAAEREALEGLRASAEKLLSSKKKEVNRIHSSIEKVAGEVAAAKQAQANDFVGFMERVDKAHSDALDAHQKQMTALQAAYKEQMKLRAPVDYWSKKASAHSNKAKFWMAWAFGSLGALALLLGVVAAWVVSTLTDGKPDAWKLAVLALVGVLGVWAVRLVVRLYLSHAHLATDAEERVTMVQTYLALLEGEKMPSDEDRKLILAPLFRPAADGLVKDEGLPHPLLEWFTRGGTK